MPKFERFCIVFLCHDVVEYGQAPNIMKDFKVLKGFKVLSFLYLFNRPLNAKKKMEG